MLHRSMSRLLPIATAAVRTQSVIPPLSRSMWHMTNSSLAIVSRPLRHDVGCSQIPSYLCSCGCGIHSIHTKGDRELVEFLQKEITEETRMKQGDGRLPSKLDGFTVGSNAAELNLTKTFNDEIITVSLNVNHTVDSDSSVELHEKEGQEEPSGELQSKPNFEVDIKIKNTTLSFGCTFVNPEENVEEGSENAVDDFGINEVTIYNDEWSESTYCVSADILDPTLYDLFMNLLDERGITNEFVDKLSVLCTDFEHTKYVGLLEQVQKFVQRK